MNFRGVSLGCVAVKRCCHTHPSHSWGGRGNYYERTHCVSPLPWLLGCHKRCPQEEQEIVHL